MRRPGTFDGTFIGSGRPPRRFRCGGVEIPVIPGTLISPEAGGRTSGGQGILLLGALLVKWGYYLRALRLLFEKAAPIRSFLNPDKH